MKKVKDGRCWGRKLYLGQAWGQWWWHILHEFPCAFNRGLTFPHFISWREAFIAGILIKKEVLFACLRTNCKVNSDHILFVRKSHSSKHQIWSALASDPLGMHRLPQNQTGLIQRRQPGNSAQVSWQTAGLSAPFRRAINLLFISAGVKRVSQREEQRQPKPLVLPRAGFIWREANGARGRWKGITTEGVKEPPALLGCFFNCWRWWSVVSRDNWGGLGWYLFLWLHSCCWVVGDTGERISRTETIVMLRILGL